MPKDRDQWTDILSAQHNGGWLTSFLAEEDAFDRRTLWRLGSWGVGAVAAVTVAVLASQSQSQLRREQLASSDLMTRQAQQIQFVARETQTEARRLSQAIDTLNSDRDRLYSRVTSIEQGLESVTGSIKRQTAVATPPAPAETLPPPTTSQALASQALAALPGIPSAPLIGPVATTAAAEAPNAKVAVREPAAKESLARETPKDVAAAAPTKASEPAAKPAVESQPARSEPLVAWKSMMAPPDAAASRLSEPAVAPPAPETTASVPPVAAVDAPAIAVARTEFGIDVGGASSVDGLRALWRGIASSNKTLAGMRPIIMIKERSGGTGMQLRLVLGPLGDAATAARICAVMTESKRMCETSVFDGQRLATKSEEPASAPAQPAPRKRAVRGQRTEQLLPPKPAEEPAPPPKPASPLSSLFGNR